MKTILLAITAAACAAAQVPDNLKPPATAVLLLKAVGKGSQIYVCKTEWTHDRPEAVLSAEDGTVIGKHYKGPTWEAVDGSKVVGQVQQRANSPSPGAIPWLLLKAASTEGTGRFAHITYIQRLDTQGGVAPKEGCDAAHAGAEVSVAYQATYLFYK